MENIIIPNERGLEKLKKAIAKEGKNKIHVIADFDRTLTKSFVAGQKTHTVIAQIREGKYLTKDYPKKAHELFNKYHPIEINPNINSEEKNRKMLEWWDMHFDLLIKSGISKQVIQDIVKKRELKFREGIKEFLEILNKNNLPLIIMSAGPGDMIEEYLRAENLLYPNIHIVANFFIFNKQGKAFAVKQPIIHSLNKHETEVKNLSIYNELLKKRNVLLLGDFLEDLGMVEGFPYKNLIKIGFLNESKPFKKGLTQNQDFENERIEEQLEDYKKNYDVVILNDGDMDYVNKLLKDIID